MTSSTFTAPVPGGFLAGGQWRADAPGVPVPARAVGYTTDAPDRISYTREMDTWAARVKAWAGGSVPADLPRARGAPSALKPHDVYVFFISGAKERAPAAAQALIARLG